MLLDKAPMACSAVVVRLNGGYCVKLSNYLRLQSQIFVNFDTVTAIHLSMMAEKGTEMFCNNNYLISKYIYWSHGQERFIN